MNYFNTFILAVFIFSFNLHSQDLQKAKTLHGVPIKPKHADLFFGKKAKIYLHNYWKFKLVDGKPGYDFSDEGIKKGFHLPDFDDSKWEYRPVPKKIFCWPGRTKEPNLLQKEGVGYLRYNIVIPEKQKGKRAILHFERVSWEPVIWVNGQEVARPKNLIPGKCADVHNIDITDAVKWGAKNQITARFFIKKTTRGYYECQNTNGIWGQSAWIEFVPLIYCSEIRISPILPNKITIRAIIINTYKVDKKIDITGLVVPWSGNAEYEKRVTKDGTSTKFKIKEKLLKSGSNKIKFTVKIKNPVLWNIDNPFLYSLKLFAIQNNTSILSFTRLFNATKECIGWERFGLREITVKGKHFYLNGEKIFLAGPGAEPSDIFCVLQHSNKGSDFWRNDNNFLRRYLTILKNSNCNAMLKTERINPQMFLNILDELGMVAIPSPDLLVESHYSDYGKKLLTTDRNAFLNEGLRRNTLAAHNHPSLIAYAPEAEGNRILGAISDSHNYRKILEKYDNTRLFSASQSNCSLARNPAGEWTPMIPPPSWDFVNHAALVGSSTIWMHHTFIPDFLAHSSKEANARWFTGNQKPHIYTEALYYYGNRAHTQYWPDILRIYGDVLKNGKIDKKLYCDLYSKGVKPNKPHWEFHYKDVSRVGIRNAFDKTNKLYPLLAAYTGEMIELCRMNDDNIQGFGSCGGPMVGIKNGRKYSDLDPASLLANDYSKIYKKTCDTIFICADLLCKHNLFTGREYATKIHCFNYSTSSLPNAKAVVEIIDNKNSIVFSDTITLGDLKKNEHKILNFRYNIPLKVKTGYYQMQFQLIVEEKIFSKNEYKLFILSHKDENMKIKTNKKVAVIGHGSRLKYGFSVCRILNKLGINYEYFSKGKGFQSDTHNLLIIDKEGAGYGKSKIEEFLKKGGRVVCLEQNKIISFLPNAKLIQPGTSYGLQRIFKDKGRIGISGDLIEPESPIFQGINHSSDWRHWFLPYGKLFSYLVYPLSEGVLLAGSDNGMKQRKSRKTTSFGMLIAEIKVGNGIVLLSQVDAIDAYGFDSIATKYLHNLFLYALSNKWDGKYAAPLR